MATKTIGGLTTVTSVLGSDYVPVWIAASNLMRKITKTNFIGAAFTGGGTLATGGFTLTVAGTSTINGSVVGNMTGSGTLATAGFTLTVPATGTAALKSASQTFTGVQTFSNGIAFANETLSAYDEGTWTPTILGSGGNPSPTYTTQAGNYTRIGNCIFFSFDVRYSATSGGSGDLRIALPFSARNSNTADSTVNAINMYNVPFDAAAQSIVFTVNAGSAYGTVQQNRSNTSALLIQVSAMAASDIFVASGHYWV